MPRIPSARALQRRLRAGTRKVLGPERTDAARSLLQGTAPPPAPNLVYLRDGGRPRTRWPAYPPAGYLGQLEPAFQARLAAERAAFDRGDCDFYHATVLRSGEVIEAPWDLRGREDAYLGGIDVGGKRVFELGPASGYLTFHMEKAGAEVVAFEVGFDRSVDMLPFPGQDVVTKRDALMHYIGAVQNSWWFVHRDRQSAAKIVYANVYDLPGDLGTFDVAVFGAVLLHLRDPWTALSQVASRTTGAIIITDTVSDPAADPERNVMRFDPSGPDAETVWWEISPGALMAMLRRLGFAKTTLTRHTQLHYMAHDMTKDPVEMNMYTLVAERG